MVTDNFLTLSHNGNGLAYFYVRSNCSETYFSPYSDLLSIELPSCPSVSVDASAIAFCSGDVSTLSVSSDYSSYQWYNADGAIDGAVGSSYLASSGGDYYVVVLTSDGCTVTSEVMTLNMISLTAVSTLEIDNITSTTATLDWIMLRRLMFTISVIVLMVVRLGLQSSVTQVLSLTSVTLVH